jgi:TRAP-type C4-dicarboxylate transport system substrate-binding protein
MRTPARFGLTLAALAACLTLASPAEPQTVIKMGTIAPEQSVWHDALLRIRQKWRDITDGEVELRIYAGGVLGGEDEMVRKMQRRTLDALAVSGSGLPLVDDIVSCLSIPLLFDSYDQLDHVRAAVAPEIERRFEGRGYKVLGWAEAGWVHFFAKEPVVHPADLRRQRLWISTGSPEHERLLNEFGFRVVALPVTDMLTGLQTGLIDAIDVPPLFALVDRSYQEAHYMTDLRFAPLNSAVLVNLPVWQRLPERYHEPLIGAVHESIAILRGEIQSAESEAVGEMQARGLTVVSLDASAVAEWEDLARSAYPQLDCARQYPEVFATVLNLQAQDAERAAE